MRNNVSVNCCSIVKNVTKYVPFKDGERAKLCGDFNAPTATF